ncbi:MAG TPA: DegT/DnrJ/EryC1/StrS family aminotransferase [Bryobacteraceae bacterium]|jgi:dTDP-4-amino-4,6-dideoxygalactose transaminase
MRPGEQIPFLDLVTPHAELREELAAVFHRAMDGAAFIGGPMVQEFERDFAAFSGAEHCVGVGSGTDALRFALMAAGVAPGDVVVTAANTFIATTEAITQAGARPAFVDIDEATYNIDEVRLRQFFEHECKFDSEAGGPIEKKTGRRVRAIIPVHLYGQTADMDAILEIAQCYNLLVIEDACQAHGAEYFSKKDNRWKRAGTMGCAAAFSFYPGKNLGACGEGGAVTTNDAELAAKIRMIRDHGQAKKYYHDFEGYNGRLDAIQAGFLTVKLKCLPEWTELRRAAASRYRELLLGTEAAITPPYEPAWAKAVYHLFVVRVRNRDEFMAHLASAGIGTGIHYPIPLHLQKAYQSLGYRKGDLPVTEKAAEEIVSLPLFPQLRADQQGRVVDEALSFAMAEAV